MVFRLAFKTFHSLPSAHFILLAPPLPGTSALATVDSPCSGVRVAPMGLDRPSEILCAAQQLVLWYLAFHVFTCPSISEVSCFWIAT